MIGNFLMAALGGALGSVLRMAVSMMVAGRPYMATLIVNFVGSLVIGVLLRNVNAAGQLHYFGIVGLCGGFTTFSTFSLETFKFIKQGDFAHALFYVFTSVVVCVAAVFIGTKIKLT